MGLKGPEILEFLTKLAYRISTLRQRKIDMSTDYFLISETHKRAVMVGSDGISGPRSWPGTPEVVEFVRWAIEDFVKDVRMVDEHTLDVLSGDDYWPDNKPPSPHKD